MLADRVREGSGRSKFKDEWGTPGNSVVIAGDGDAGFFGEVAVNDFIAGDDLSTLVGLRVLRMQHLEDPWLKFVIDEKIIFVAKKTLRYRIGWNALNSYDVVYGNQTVEVKGKTYKVRLMRGASNDPPPYNDASRSHGSEWNRLMLPIHEKSLDGSWRYPENVRDDVPVWAHNYGNGNQGMYTDGDLLTTFGYGHGRETVCLETYSSMFNVYRGFNDVSFSGITLKSEAEDTIGWRPVLELDV